ncbi:hypothetical protein [Streptomyces sp. enrichment culture]
MASLHARCQADYGTPQERAERAARARVQSSISIEHAREAAL